MKEQVEIRLEIEQLEDRIAPSGLGACLTTSPPSGTGVSVSVGAAAVAADGNGVVSVVSGTC